MGGIIKGITSIFSGGDAKKAARASAQAITDAQNQAIGNYQGAQDKINALFAPYEAAGQKGLAGAQDLIGLGTPGSQQAAINALMAGPEYQSLIRSGEDAILQNASATGGLRGGNIQDALSRFRPEVLASLINQQFQRLGGFGQLGLQATVPNAQSIFNTGQQIGGAYTNIGNANSNMQQQVGQANQMQIGGIGNIAGSIFGAVNPASSFGKFIGSF